MIIKLKTLDFVHKEFSTNVHGYPIPRIGETLNLKSILYRVDNLVWDIPDDSELMVSIYIAKMT